MSQPAEMDVAPTCEVAAASGAGEVAVETGVVRGVKEGATWAYKGIPYAAPPVGALRWRAPQPAACWSGVREATSFGAKCPQLDLQQRFEGDEDCLTINVWTPDKAAPAGGWPVMFFIHGGGNIQGSASDALVGGRPIYDGSLLGGAMDVVVVTINYRLGALGYMALDELDAESAGSGNWGLRDQIAALGWVQQNIEAFGGDKGRVMIFGESAGAVNVCALMTAGPAAGLFHRALMQSGGCFSTPREVAKRDAAAFVEQSSCKEAAEKLACLRELSAEAALRALPSSLESLFSTGVTGQDRPFGPSHGDGALLAKQPLDALQAGEFAKVPFVIGTNLDEMANLLGARPQTAQQYEQLIRQAFLPLGRDIPDLVLDMYPASDYASPHDAIIQVYSDARFTCPARTIARAVSARQPDATWRYFFTRRAVTAQGTVPAQHGIELVYVFGSINSIPLYRPAAEDTSLATAMQRYWSEFARGGAPGDAGGPMWPTLDGAADHYLELGTQLRVSAGVNPEKCDLWDGLIARFTD